MWLIYQAYFFNNPGLLDKVKIKAMEIIKMINLVCVEHLKMKKKKTQSWVAYHSTSAATSYSKKDGEKSSNRESLLKGGGLPHNLWEETKNAFEANFSQVSKVIQDWLVLFYLAMTGLKKLAFLSQPIKWEV